MNKAIKKLHQQGKIWSATKAQNTIASVDSGYQELNQHLHGGLPKKGVIEVQTLNGIGELRLFIPYLLNLLSAEKANNKHIRQIVFIAPPAQVNALMLLKHAIPLECLLIISSEHADESLWAAEQCLKSGCCFAVLLWQQLLAAHQVKRLKQAAITGDAVQIIFRSPERLNVNLPVSLSLSLEAKPIGLKVNVIKQKGGWPCQPFTVDMRQLWPMFTDKQQVTNEDKMKVNNVVPLSKPSSEKIYRA